MGSIIKNLFKLIATNDDLSYLGAAERSNPVDELIRGIYKDTFHSALHELKIFNKLSTETRADVKKEMLTALSWISKDIKVDGIDSRFGIYFSFHMKGDNKLSPIPSEFVVNSCKPIVKLIKEQAAEGDVHTLELAQEYLDKLVGSLEEEIGDRIIDLAVKNAKLLIEYADSGNDELGLFR